MQFKSLFLLFSAVSLFACSNSPKLKVQEGPAISHSMQKGFSLSFPNQNEWTVIKDNPYKIVMTKSGQAEKDRYMIQALVVKLPKFDNDEDFMGFITNRMKQSQNQSDTKVSDEQIQFVEGKNNKCVQYKGKEQRSSKAVMLEVVSFTCRHPDRENAGVYLAYSKKYSQGNGDKNLGAKAEGLFNHMELVAF